MKHEYVFNLSEALGEDFRIGVVLHLEKKHNQFHCGLAFDLDKSPNVIHLASHNDLRCDENLDEFECIIKTNLHQFTQESFESLCEVIRSDIQNGKIQVPYGFLYDDYALIHDDGTLELTPNEVGLTCATYVLTLFHSCGYNLVDIKSWPPRKEDIPWYSNMVSLFDRFGKFLGVSSEHLERLKQQVNVPRFRPEEVAVSSALFNGQPADTIEIWEHGKELKEYMYSII